MDPYILGCILGDGSISRKSIVLSISSPYVIDRMISRLKPGYKIIKQPSRKDYEYSLVIDRDSETHKNKTNLLKQSNEYISALRSLDLMGKTALNKFIPKRYLNGSTEQRLELLRGLMDTDGCVGKDGTLAYSTSSLQLAEDIQYLIRSLGGLAKIRSKIPFYTHKGERKQGNLNYIIGIRMKNPLSIVTRPEKRAERLKETNQYSDTLKLRIVSIESNNGVKAHLHDIQKDIYFHYHT
jgi:intein/homing endonuclease